ncbi:NADH-quinone oxidoreductase chain 2 [Aquicella lusitana]|uniref:NADH-quinone oxidoreductase subunit E n=2 Tax=Aquicella lusitana TaxID=254246 RepID=A0A370GTC0_9COXI|nr:NAD(P)H-dependent oxidoreductase subunit E [Aquicella lusitana]RDI46925.1 NADH dehydrogenase subunit E [Aquicella lusitana]VVC73816.1 NADH-quinone oxidoreductase chain 2 [Aquicella lusitana]
MMTENKKTVLTPAIRARIDEWILRYPPEQKRSGVFEALRLVQEENGGSLTVEWMDAVADYLEMPRIAVYEVATFYTLYHLEPVGRHVIQLCTNISCMLNGSEKILAHLKNRLNVDVNETTADGKFTLKEVECLGACVTPPVCQIGKTYYENLTAEKIDEILGKLG